MQYLLTAEEYKEVVELKHQICCSRVNRLSEKKLGELCVKIADTMPVKWVWDREVRMNLRNLGDA